MFSLEKQDESDLKVMGVPQEQEQDSLVLINAKNFSGDRLV
jgi:hypothetical protein